MFRITLNCGIDNCYEMVLWLCFLIRMYSIYRYCLIIMSDRNFYPKNRLGVVLELVSMLTIATSQLADCR